MRITAGSGDRAYEITGSVLNLIPLRNRRTTPEGEQLVTRISEGMTEWQWDGRTGYGLSEYLDQIVDGQPVGGLTAAGTAGADHAEPPRLPRCTPSVVGVPIVRSTGLEKRDHVQTPRSGYARNLARA